MYGPFHTWWKLWSIQCGAWFLKTMPKYGWLHALKNCVPLENPLWLSHLKFSKTFWSLLKKFKPKKTVKIYVAWNSLVANKILLNLGPGSVNNLSSLRRSTGTSQPKAHVCEHRHLNQNNAYIDELSLCRYFPEQTTAGVQPRWIQGNSKVGTELASWKKLI